MPLYDVDWKRRPGEPLSFLFGWAAAVADALNAGLPSGERRFLAEMDCRMKLKTAEAVASFNYGPPTVCDAEDRETGQKYPAFDPPAPTLIAPARFTDRFGVKVIDHLDGRHVAAVVLFVGEDHKADSDGALAFAVRAAGFMSAGVGVVIVDALPGSPTWATHLHSLTGVYPMTRRPRGGEAPVLVVHPRAESASGAQRYDVWHHTVAVGLPLPTVPVPVCGAMHLKLDLEATYTEAWTRLRIPE